MNEPNLQGLAAHERDVAKREALVAELETWLIAEAVGMTYWELAETGEITEHTCADAVIDERVYDNEYIVTLDGHAAWAVFDDGCELVSFCDHEHFFLTQDAAVKLQGKVMG